MKKTILILMFSVFGFCATAQMPLVATMTFTSDSTATEVRQYYLLQPIIDFQSQQIVFRNQVKSTIITANDTIIDEKVVKYFIVKSDSVQWRNGYLKARSYYNFYFANGIDKLIKLNKALIYKNPKR